MSQDIVLVSNASMDLFPDNKLHDFRIRLPVPLSFDPSYKVAVTRASFTKSYFNYDPPQSEKRFWIVLSDNKMRYEPDAASINNCRIMGYLKAGYYNPESFIEMINKCAQDLLITGTDKNKTNPTFVLKNNYLQVRPGTFINSGGSEVRYELDFDGYTKQCLGIEKAPQRVRPVYLNQGWTDLYVYSDLVYPSIVGDRHANLLAILDGQTEKDYGSHCCETFDELWFHELANYQFQQIGINIRTDTGKTPIFRFGRVSLRLTFRKIDG